MIDLLLGTKNWPPNNIFQKCLSNKGLISYHFGDELSCHHLKVWPVSICLHPILLVELAVPMAIIKHLTVQETELWMNQ